MRVSFRPLFSILLMSFCLSASAADEYLFVVGSAFTARASGQLVTDKGSGCIYSTSALTTDLQLPQGSTIKAVRLSYKNTSSAQRVEMYLSKYDGAGSLDDIQVGNSSQSGGYHTQNYPLASPEVIDNETYSYTLTARMNGASASLCGMRVLFGTP